MRSGTASVPKLRGLSRRRHAGPRPPTRASSRPAQTPRRGSDSAVVHHRPALPEAPQRGLREKGRSARPSVRGSEAMRQPRPGMGAGTQAGRGCSAALPPRRRKCLIEASEDPGPRLEGVRAVAEKPNRSATAWRKPGKGANRGGSGRGMSVKERGPRGRSGPSQEPKGQRQEETGSPRP